MCTLATVLLTDRSGIGAPKASMRVWARETETSTPSAVASGDVGFHLGLFLPLPGLQARSYMRCHVLMTKDTHR